MTPKVNTRIYFWATGTGKIFKIKQFYSPDSLCGLYAALTDYLGFETLDGEFKVMGLAAHGDSEKYG